MSEWLDKVIPKCDVPEGESGDYKVQRFTITKEGAKMYNLSLMFSFCFNRNVHEGTFTRLTSKDALWMSDTDAERRDSYWFVEKAHGKVLINGLGLGIVANACLIKPEVTSVTVIEINPNVNYLVTPHLKNKFGERYQVILADALQYRPTKYDQYDCAWHDIWTDICLDNYEEYKLLHRKWGKRVKYQDSWCIDRLRQMRREEGRFYEPVIRG